jgi:hypothetical protein
VSQQLNLLGQVQTAPALSALRAMSGLGVMLAILLAYAAFEWYGTVRLTKTAAQTSAQLVAQKAALQVVEKKIAERPKLADIVAQIDALKQQAAESQQLLSLLRSEGASEGYSGHLTTLARITEDGVWLTGAKISNGGKTVSITGRSLRQESVLRYAQRLNDQFSAQEVQLTAMELTPEYVKEGTAAPRLSFVAFKLF